MIENEEDREWDEFVFLYRLGLNMEASIPKQLAQVRALIAEKKEQLCCLEKCEARIEAWARSGDFVLAVPGEPVTAVVTNRGAVLVVHDHG